MRVVHNLAWYLPSHIGGTEVYVDALARSLVGHGVESVVLVPDETPSERLQDGIRVISYPHRPARGGAGWEADPPDSELAEFKAWLVELRPDIFHLHSWMPDSGLHHLRTAHSLALPSVMTVHVPGPVCPRGTMLRNGRDICDGRIQPRRCAACRLQSRGVPEMLTGLASTLGWTDSVRRHKQRLLEAAHLSRRVVAVSRWLQEALLVNGVPASKVVLSRQGLSDSPPQTHRLATEQITVGFISRLDPLKGLHILVEAFRALPRSIPLRLKIYGEASGAEHQRYEAALRERAKVDTRIEFLGRLARAALPEALASFDVLAVPSQWLETGPIVVLEAAQAGVPVLGSDLGGIGEWLDSGISGWKVPFNDVGAWLEALQELPVRLRRLPRSLPSVRSARDVAHEMHSLYRGILAQGAVSAR